MDVGIAVVGAGPIGAATLHHLAGRADVALVARAGPHADDTYRQSGGSICWHRPDPSRATAIAETARVLTALTGNGAPIRLRDTPYLFLDAGEFAPGLNVFAPDLVSYLVAQAGTPRIDVGDVQAVERTPGGYRVVGSTGVVTAAVVVLACGTNNRALFPALNARVEKRSLMVLDTPVDDARAGLPHIVCRLGDGYVYAFVKELDGALRLLVGQEDLIDDVADAPVDHLPDLIRAGLAARLPYLDGAHTVDVLWGTDFVGKDPQVHTDGAGLISVTCGSAVRSCIDLGRRAARAATGALRPAGG